MENLLAEIKTLIVNTLELEDIDPSSIGDEEALFDEGLGLDSIDALELGIALQKAYGIEIDEEDEALPEHFQNAQAFAKRVETNRS